MMGCKKKNDVGQHGTLTSQLCFDDCDIVETGSLAIYLDEQNFDHAHRFV
jgi:hypothetical protein